MSNEIFYKDYTGTINYCNTDNILYGRVTSVPDETIISYHGDTIDEVIRAFHEMVDFHIEAEAEEEAISA